MTKKDEKVADKFPEKIRLGKTNQPVTLGTINPYLKNARFMIIILVEDNEKTDETGVHFFSNGLWRFPDDSIKIHEVITRNLGVIAIPLGLVPPTDGPGREHVEHPKKKPKKKETYVI